jgi:hypothetical protein
VDQHDVKASDRQEVKHPTRQIIKDGEDDNNDAGVHSGEFASMVRQSCLCG